MSAPDDLRELVRRYWEGVWGQQDLSLLDELFSDPYTRHTAAGTAVLSREQVKDELARAWELVHGASTTVDDQAIAGDRIWTRSTTRGINLQTGSTSVLTFLVVHRVQDGRFVESWSATLPGVDWR